MKEDMKDFSEKIGILLKKTTNKTTHSAHSKKK